MALGASQITGKPSAMAVVPGPGVLNAGAGLTSAYWGGGRVLSIVGAIADAQRGLGIGALHELPDQTAVLRQVTKHAAYVPGGDRAVEIIQQALAALMANESRPVSIEVPVSAWGDEVDGVLAAVQRSTPALNADSVDRVAQILGRAERPVIVVGSGAYEAGPEVAALAEMLQAPITTRRQGHGVVDSRHPLWVPLPIGREYWGEADVVIGIGSRMEWPIMHWGTEDLTIVQINVDVDEIDRHGLGTVGVHADAKEAITALLDATGPQNRTRTDRTADVAERRARYDSTVGAELGPQRDQLRAIRDVLPDDGVIVEDVTQLTFAAHLLFEFRHPRTFLTSGPAGTLGAGVAQAIGAQAASPDQNVLAIVGDGGFMFTATELATAVQHDIPVTILLSDNSSYGNVKRIQQQRFGPDRTIASDLVNPDFVKFGESFGIHTERADDNDQLRASLERAFAHPGPSLVVSPLDDVPSPWPHLVMPKVRGS